MAVPAVMTVDLNDDESERRRRRLKTNIGSLLSPGYQTPKLSHSGQGIRYTCMLMETVKRPKANQ